MSRLTSEVITHDVIQKQIQDLEIAILMATMELNRTYSLIEDESELSTLTGNNQNSLLCDDHQKSAINGAQIIVNKSKVLPPSNSSIYHQTNELHASEHMHGKYFPNAANPSQPQQPVPSHQKSYLPPTMQGAPYYQAPSHIFHGQFQTMNSQVPPYIVHDPIQNMNSQAFCINP